MSKSVKSEKNISFSKLIEKMKIAQDEIFKLHGVNDIFTSSKVFEILIASALGHDLIPGQSGTADATDPETHSKQFEYKHFKELSSNHSWTFNDFSDNVIKKIGSKIDSVFYCHINDVNFPPILDWYFELTGEETARYLSEKTPAIKNSRKMINISKNQIEDFFRDSPNVKKTIIEQDSTQMFNGKYCSALEKIFTSVNELEKSLGLKNLLTSSKLWELVVAEKLGHFVNSEQGGRAGAHDAHDANGSWYEYKVDQSLGWSFQDISDAVLSKYSNLEAFILAVVDKPNFTVKEIYRVEAKPLIAIIKQKRKDKEMEYKSKGKEIRRSQVTVGKRELDLANASRLF
jgi:hypothetical protein